MTTVLVGAVISDTMRPQDLLPTFVAELENVAPKDYDYWDKLNIPKEAMHSEDAGWWETEEAWTQLELVFDWLNDEAPEGYYFGSHPGDGACFGWWEVDES